VNLIELMRERASPDCIKCGGTGIIEGEEHVALRHPILGVIATQTDPDRVCDCVSPITIIAEDIERQHDEERMDRWNDMLPEDDRPTKEELDREEHER